MKTVWCIFRFRCLHFRLQQIFYAQRDNRQQTTKPAIIIHFAQNNVMHTWYLREFINTKQTNQTHTYNCMLCHCAALHIYIAGIAHIALIILAICSHICFGRVAKWADLWLEVRWSIEVQHWSNLHINFKTHIVSVVFYLSTIEILKEFQQYNF